MNKHTFGSLLRATRKKHNLSQTALGAEVGLSQSRLSQFESDSRSPTPEEWQRLRECLNLDPNDLPAKLLLPYPDPIWRVALPELSLAGERPLSTRHHAARKTYGAIVDRRLAQAKSQTDPVLVEKFLNQASTESGHEYFLWVQLLAIGGKPCWLAPVRAGFRALGIVDRHSKRAINDLRHPCLQAAGPGADWLLFPQPTLDARRTYYRLDALAVLRYGGERHWIDLELDGQGHNPEWDDERQRLLSLPTVRLSTAEIATPDIMATLEAKAFEVLRRKKAG